jgi:dihydroneopterin aldolase
MGKIQVNNIKLYANHGCLNEEAMIGSWYRVDIEVNVDLTKSSISDDLEDTVDYVQLNHIVKEEMVIRSKLLEEVANRILDRFFLELKMITSATVSVAKLNPPIGGNVPMA